jgi:hypothetical protein
MIRPIMATTMKMPTQTPALKIPPTTEQPLKPDSKKRKQKLKTLFFILYFLKFVRSKKIRSPGRI